MRLGSGVLEPGLAMCKARALSIVLSLWPNLGNFFKLLNIVSLILSFPLFHDGGGHSSDAQGSLCSAGD